MSLVEQLKLDQVTAMKAKDEEGKAKLSPLRLLISELEKEKVLFKMMNVTDLSDEQVMNVINRQVKKVDKEIESYLQVGFEIDKQLTERKLLQSYLPKQLTPEEIVVRVAEVVAGSSNIGEAMKVLKPELNGKADMKFVSQAVQQAFKSK